MVWVQRDNIGTWDVLTIKDYNLNALLIRIIEIVKQITKNAEMLIVVMTYKTT